MTVGVSKLLPFRRDREGARLRLVCLPFAGGGAAVFRDWGPQLPDDVDVCAIQLPGRGTRFDETPIDDPRRLVDSLAADLARLVELPTILFGHSLGAWIAFAMARAGIRADALVASGSRAPHLPARKRYGELPTDELLVELRRLGGTPREILDDPELVELFLPMLRADFKLVDRLLVSADEQLRAPITVLAATDDNEVSLAEAAAWEIHTKGEFHLAPMSGGHLFVASRPAAVLAEVRRVIDATLAP